jgi:hypothetical protein
MAKGTIYGTTSNEYIDVKIEWSSTTDVATNRSKVTASLYYRRNNSGFETYGTGSFSISFGGEQFGTSVSVSIDSAEWVCVYTNSHWIAHNSDGTKTITISATGHIFGTSLTSTSCSGLATLDTIQRASTITSAGDVTLGNVCSVKWTPLLTYYRFKVKFSMGGWSYTTGIIQPKTTSAYTYNEYLIPLEAANQIPNAKTGTMTATLYTYSDSDATVQVGSASSKTFTVTVPNSTSTKPSVSMTLAPVTSGTAFADLYLQGRSKVKATLSGEGKYSATISSYSASVEGVSSVTGSNPFTSVIIPVSGQVTVTGTAIDSRGYSNKVEQEITVIPYSEPSLSPVSGEKAIVCARCDADGNLSESGTYLKIKAKRSYSKVEVSGEQKNFCSIRYRYKPEGGSFSSWATILAADTASDEIVTSALLDGKLLKENAYEVQVGVIDTVGETGGTTVSIPTEKVYWHRAGSIRSFGLGEYVEEENTFSVAEDIGSTFKGGINAIEIPEYTDFNTLTKPNRYYARYTYVPGYTNCPISVQTTFALEVIAMGKDGQVMQRITRCSADATVYQRQYYSNAWHEWECVNPPMVVGEEYRTTERYMGKPVYTKLIYCETLPNTTYKLFPHGATVKQAIRCVGQMSDGNSLPFRFNATNYVEIYAGPENVVIFAGNDKTNRSAYAQMWYVKE